MLLGDRLQPVPVIAHENVDVLARVGFGIHSPCGRRKDELPIMD